MNRVVMVLLLLAPAAWVGAGEATGLVAGIYVAEDSDVVLFYIDGPLRGTPRCNDGQRFSLSLRKPGGMATYLALLEAKREKYGVKVSGANLCANDWKSEDMINLYIK